VRAAYLGGAPQAVDAAGGVRMTEAGDPR
jgi:hypothetical protein